MNEKMAVPRGYKNEFFSYEKELITHIPSFEMLRPTVVKLEEFLKETGCTIHAGTSFHLFLLILF